MRCVIVLKLLGFLYGARRAPRSHIRCFICSGRGLFSPPRHHKTQPRRRKTRKGPNKRTVSPSSRTRQK